MVTYPPQIPDIYIFEYQNELYMIKHIVNTLIIRNVKDPWGGISRLEELLFIAKTYCFSKGYNYRDRFIVTFQKKYYIRVRIKLDFTREDTHEYNKITGEGCDTYNYKIIKKYLPHLIEDFNKKFST